MSGRVKPLWRQQNADAAHGLENSCGLCGIIRCGRRWRAGLHVLPHSHLPNQRCDHCDG